MSSSRNRPERKEKRRLTPIVEVKESLVTIDATVSPVTKNEVGHILLGKERLMAEVLRIEHGRADMQVFEDTRGVKVGDTVELSGEMLSVSLGPGLLGEGGDGRQNPLEVLAKEHGFFLPRGQDVAALRHDRTAVSDPRRVV